jgi:hypothetical protein
MSDCPGALYVVANPAWPGWFKVGRAEYRSADDRSPSNAVRGRLTQYNTGDPRRAYELIKEDYAACCVSAERYVHTFLELHCERGQGEWFHGPPDLIVDLVERACAIARMPPNRRSDRFQSVLEEVHEIVPDGGKEVAE